MGQYAGNWYIIGDSQSLGNESLDITPWWYGLEQAGLIDATVNAAGGRALFWKGYEGGDDAGPKSDPQTWNIDDLTDEDCVLIYCATNDSDDAGESRFKYNLETLITDLEALGYERKYSIYIVAAAEPDEDVLKLPFGFWDAGHIRTWQADVWGNCGWSNILYETLDGVHRTQLGNNRFAQDMYKNMLGAYRRYLANDPPSVVALAEPEPESEPGPMAPVVPIVEPEISLIEWLDIAV
jgi:hypothetical protein